MGDFDDEEADGDGLRRARHRRFDRTAWCRAAARGALPDRKRRGPRLLKSSSCRAAATCVAVVPVRPGAPVRDDDVVLVRPRRQPGEGVVAVVRRGRGDHARERRGRQKRPGGGASGAAGGGNVRRGGGGGGGRSSGSEPWGRRA